MSGRLKYPPVDARRSSALRTDLLRDVAALAPDWRGIAEATGHDRALVEIAARLIEQSTRRLDKTPERDALAFLDMFDIPAPQPRAAEGFAVFALAEDRTHQETVAKGTGLEIGDRLTGELVRFETAADLPLHPARIGLLACVDPAADAINVAPLQVTALEDDGVPDVAYQLEATAGPGDSVIRLSHAVGLAAGDLLRIEPAAEGGVVRYVTVSESSEEGLVTLDAPLPDPGLIVGDVARIRRMTAFEAFAMPDRQAHALYLGDSDALNVSEPADISLTLHPPERLADLTAHPFVLEAWGLREAPGDPEDVARWHRLPSLGAAGSTLRYLKGWTGPLEETEIAPGLSGRWLRLRREGPITTETAAESPPLMDRIEIQVATQEPDGDAGEGTVSQVAHNATPLPLPAFLPFGAEPRRFDTFSLAAPETFTKYGALARLTFDLLDATLANMTAALRTDDARHLYGIARNGRLQVIDAGAAFQVWREAKGPEAETDTGQALRLDPRFEPRAVEVASADINWARDIVVVSDTSGHLWCAQIAIRTDGGLSGDDVVVETGWSQLPALPNGPDAAAGLAALPLGANPSIGSVLIHADASGLRGLGVDLEGRPYGSAWQEIDTTGGPSIDAGARLAAIPGTAVGNTGLFALTDTAGALYLVEYNGAISAWHALETSAAEPIVIADGQFPAVMAFEDGGTPHLAVAWATGNAAATLRFAAFDLSGLVPQPVAAAEGSIDLGLPLDGLRLGLIAGMDFAERPSVVATQVDANGVTLFDWSPRGGDEDGPPFSVVARDALPLVNADGQPTATGPAALFSATAMVGPTAVMAGKNERLLRLDFNRSAFARFFSWIHTDTPPANLDDHFVGFTRTGPGGVPVPGALPAEVVGAVTLVGPWAIGIPEPPTLDTTRPFFLVEEQGGTDVGTIESSGASGLRLSYIEDDLAHGVPTVDDVVIVRTGGAPDQRAVFVVDSVDANADSAAPSLVTLTDQPAFDIFGAGVGGNITFEIAGTTATVPTVTPGTDANYGTIAVLEGPATAPASITTGLAPGVALQAFDLSSGGLVSILLPPWPGGTAPLWQATVKIQETGGGPGVPNQPVQSFTSEPLARDFQAPDLSWEYNNGAGWKRLDSQFADTTLNLSRGGTVSFRIPNDLSLTEIGGQEDLWVRARLVGGDYGRPSYVITSDPPAGSPQTQTITVDTSHMRPPEIGRVTAHFTDMPPRAPARVITRNNLRDVDQSSANVVEGALWPVYEGAFQTAIGAGNRRALLLGLTHPLPAGLVTLYVRAEDADPAAEIAIETLGAEMTWSRAPFATDDPTRGMNQSGLLSFSVTVPPAQVSLFNRTAHWLRIVSDGTGWLPRITGLWLNGTPILQAETIRQELVGSSLGQKDLTLSLLKSPVLEDSLELRVREKLSEEEVAALMANADAEASPPVVWDVPDIPGQWVLWRQVSALTGQGNARVYLLSPDSTVTFGNGQDGRIPAAGTDGIRAFRYQVGGQPARIDALAEVKPRAPVPGFESALVPEPISGGTGPARPEALVARMPDALRHRGTGLSLADLEALARDFDSEIVQARADPAQTARDRVRVTVLARGEGRAPVYRRARRDHLARALARAASDAWPETCIEVRSARILPISVVVELTALPGQATGLFSAATETLLASLHAAEGGPDGSGWPIGRRPWPMDIERALAGTDGLDRVVAVRIAAADGLDLPTLAEDQVPGLIDTDALALVVQEATA